MSCLVLFEESGNPGGELADCSLLLSHHAVQVQLHLTHWGGGEGNSYHGHTLTSQMHVMHTLSIPLFASLCLAMWYKWLL